MPISSLRFPLPNNPTKSFRHWKSSNLCIKLRGGVSRIGAGIGGRGSGGSGATPNPSQVAACVSGSGRRPWQNLSSRFLSRNPLEYLWPGGRNRVATDYGLLVSTEEMEWVPQVPRPEEMQEAATEDCSGCEVDYDEDEEHDDGEKSPNLNF